MFNMNGTYASRSPRSPRNDTGLSNLLIQLFLLPFNVIALLLTTIGYVIAFIIIMSICCLPIFLMILLTQ